MLKNSYADMTPGEVAENFSANLEDTLFKLKCEISKIRDDRYVFDVSTVALVMMLGEHLAKDKAVATDEYMLKVHQKLVNMVDVSPPTLLLVPKTEVNE